MAQLVLNIIDGYHDIMDNKSGEYFFNIYYLIVSTYNCVITSKTLFLKKLYTTREPSEYIGNTMTV